MSQLLTSRFRKVSKERVKLWCTMDFTAFDGISPLTGGQNIEKADGCMFILECCFAFRALLPLPVEGFLVFICLLV